MTDTAIETLGHFETALLAFKRRPPIVHLTAAPGALRQALLIGARLGRDPENQEVICSGRRLLVLVETDSGRLHCFRYIGPPLEIEEAALEQLCAIADASCAYGSGACTLNFQFRRRLGWRAEPQTHAAEDVFMEIGEEPDEDGWFTPLPEISLCGASPADALVAEVVRLLADHCASIDDTHDGEQVERAARQIAHESLQSFLSRLPGTAVSLCEGLRCSSIAAYNGFTHSDARILKYRLQAAEAIPVLGFLLGRGNHVSAITLRVAIDRRSPLIAAAVAAFGPSSECFRFLVGKRLDALAIDDPRIEDLWLNTPEFMFASIASIAAEQRPKTRDEWRAFYELVEPLVDLRETFDSAVAPVLRHAGTRGFRATVDGIRRKLGHLSILSEYGAFLNALGRVLPKNAHRSADKTDSDSWKDALLQTRGLLNLAIDTERWRRQAAREATVQMVKFGGAAIREQVPPPFPMPEQIGPWHIVFLDSAAALVEEGIRMSHCIASFYPDLFKRSRLPFSIRRRGNLSVATFDISFEGDSGVGHKVHVNQVCGFENSEPSQEIKDIVAHFEKAVNDLAARNRVQLDCWLTEGAVISFGRFAERYDAMRTRAERNAARQYLSNRSFLRALRQAYERAGLHLPVALHGAASR